MTVAELIEELKQLPQHHPILCGVGLRHAESIKGLAMVHLSAEIGPVAVICADADERNDGYE